MNLPWLSPTSNEFPPITQALKKPSGLLAAGGDLSPERLIQAYKQGIFPWYSEDEPILWWHPDPRMVLFPEQLHIARSLAKTLKKNLFSISLDKAFTEVIKACATRSAAEGTWITAEMQQAYIRLHELGIAHSVEAWQDDRLVGGLYGVAVGKVFYGESMFSRKTNASKVTFIHAVNYLKEWGYKLIDCQVSSQHLQQFGAAEISRSEFIELLSQLTIQMPTANAWQLKEIYTHHE